MKAKTHILNAFPKVKLFDSHKCCIQLKQRMFRKIRKASCTTKSSKIVQLQDKPGKQNFHEKIKKVFESVTDIIKNTSENLTKTIAETSIKYNEAKENLNEKVLELMNDKSMIAP